MIYVWKFLSNLLQWHKNQELVRNRISLCGITCQLPDHPLSSCLSKGHLVRQNGRPFNSNYEFRKSKNGFPPRISLKQKFNTFICLKIWVKILKFCITDQNLFFEPKILFKVERTSKSLFRVENSLSIHSTNYFISLEKIKRWVENCFLNREQKKVSELKFFDQKTTAIFIPYHMTIFIVKIMKYGNDLF